MMKTAVTLVGIPPNAKVGGVDIGKLIHRAERSEFVMQKGVCSEDESSRFLITCDRLEYLVMMLVDGGEVETCRLGAGYFDLVEKLVLENSDKCKTARLLSNICSVDMVGERLAEFERLMSGFDLDDDSDIKSKTAFYKRALENSWSVIELQEVSFDGLSENETIEETVLKKDFLSLAVSDDIVLTNESASSGLKKQIRLVINSQSTSSPMSVNFSDQSHIAIANVLNEFVYMKGTKMSLPVTYGDGSKARPFPIYCLQNREAAIPHSLLNNEKPVPIAMMSSRHDNEGLGKKTKMAWFLNIEMSSGKPAGEIDELAYQQSKELLSKMRKEGFFRFEFYQTGFQPVIVGFYRAVVEDLMTVQYSQPRYQIVPIFSFKERDTGEEKNTSGRSWC
jgi:hypothetical protein